jgi:hypothetical protein
VFAYNTASVTFSSASGSLYPFNANVWTPFTSSATFQVSGTVDEFGPCRNGQSLPLGNVDYTLQPLSLNRDSFSVPNTTDYIITWIGVETVSDDRVMSWLDTNSIIPAVTDPGELGTIIYPTVAIKEAYNSTTGKYEFGQFKIYAKIKSGVNEQWNPKLHSGWFTDDIREYYLYANPQRETATASSKVLIGPNRLGAPILVKAVPANGNADASPAFDMRQIAVYDDSATPTLAASNIEIVPGTGANYLYASYKDIYGISVFDMMLNQAATPSSTSTSTNIIPFATATNKNHNYKLTYSVNKSFWVDNQYIDNGTPTARIFFDKAPSSYGMSTYRIDYETSKYDPATPVDMPLNNLHTSIDEGFVYVDHEIHNFNQMEVRISPSKITADGIDYALVTFRTYDTNGNPKPNQSLNLFTNFGTLSKSSVVTDRDGFAYATLTSELWDGSITPSPATPALKAATPGTDDEGIILADGPGAVDAKVGFKIQIPPPAQYRIIAILDSDFILADGNSATNIFGLVEDSNHTPVPFAVVYWRKARTEYEVFKKGYNASTATPGSSNTSGYVVADANGRFTIGPFVSSQFAGYWLTVLETGSASPNLNRNQFDIVGDMVYWYEHPDITNMIDPITQMPVSNIQDATPYWNIPNYLNKTTLPVTYDENDIQAGYTGSATPSWLPPKWWAIDRYTQYLIGLDGTSYDTFRATPSYPDYKDF